MVLEKAEVWGIAVESINHVVTSFQFPGGGVSEMSLASFEIHRSNASLLPSSLC